MHVPTLFLTAAAVLAVLAALMVFFASLRRVFPGFRHWALGQVAASLGLILLALRGTAPDVVTILLGNLCVLLHPVLAARGFRRFYGLPRGPRIEADVAVVAATLALIAWFRWGHPDVSLRIVAFGLASGALHLRAGLSPLTTSAGRASGVQRVLAAMFGVLALIYLGRAAWFATLGRDLESLFADPTLPIQVLGGLSAQVAIACGLIYLNFARAGQALAEKEQRLRLAHEAAGAGVWEHDPRTASTYWSEGLYRLYGLTPDACRPSHQAWLDTVHPDDRPAVEAAIAASEQGGTELEVEWRVRDARPTRWLLTRGRTLPESDAGPGRRVGIVLDVTDRRRAEEALRAIEREKALAESEARFRALIEKSTDIVVVLDATWTVRFFSPGGTAALGWTETEVLGRRGKDYLHPDDVPRVHGPFAGLLSNPRSAAHTSFRVRHKDGSWRRIDCVARNHLEDSVLEGVVVNARDVTEQERLRERLADGQRLESIGQLAGGVAHDFNNLLTAILGAAECLRDSAERREPPASDDVEAVHEAATRAAELTRQLLAFARRQPVAPAPVDLWALVRDLQRLVRRLLPESIALQVDGVGEPWVVRADAGQLRQVILNLAANARDAMPAGGALSIETSRAYLDAQAAAEVGAAGPGEFVRLTVRDTGVGIEPEAQARLFEPFYTTKALGRGTGLGLAAVHGIVKQSQGTIAVESAPGRGTAVRVYLPRHEASAPAAEPRPTSPRHGRGERVLLVEDEALVRNVAERALRRAGYDVLVACDGKAALALSVPPADIDLLITDVVMPGLHGGQLATALRERLPHLKVLYVSGFTHDAIANHGVLEEGLELLEKPFVAATLLERVRRLLDATSPAPP